MYTYGIKKSTNPYFFFISPHNTSVKAGNRMWKYFHSAESIVPRWCMGRGEGTGDLKKTSHKIRIYEGR